MIERIPPQADCGELRCGPKVAVGLAGANVYCDREAHWSGAVRIKNDILKCVVFICRERLIDGQSKVVPVATAFLVSMEPTPNVFAHYLVTCRHVIETDPDSILIVRVNTTEGRSRNIQTEARHWYLHDAADLAVLPFTKEDDLDLRSVHHSSHFVGANQSFVTVFPIPGTAEVNRETHYVTTGDAITAIGLFIEDYGESANFPVARFGHISRMPSIVNTPRWQDDTFRSAAYLAEFFAYPGLSGSPVIWFTHVMATKVLVATDKGKLTKAEEMLIPALIGCVNGYIPRQQRADVQGDVLGTITMQINTGIATVTPAAAIEQLLMIPELVAQREEIARRATGHAGYVIPATRMQIGAIHEPCFGRPALAQHETPVSLTPNSPPPSTESGPRLGGAAVL